MVLMTRERTRVGSATSSGTTDRTSVTIDQLSFRRTLGHLATGVTVVTTYKPGGVHGMTANAVTPVSLAPARVLVCVGKHARLARHVQQPGAFGINLLSEDQEPLSRFFSGSWDREEPPEHQFLHWSAAPFLVGSLGALSCQVTRVFDGGDHLIVVGQVMDIRIDDPDGKPLIFYRGRYTRLANNGHAAGTRWAPLKA
jgi:flavin reductase (DIM6/NTAB) family NADH-FMN oxidoreductase RutF